MQDILSPLDGFASPLGAKRGVTALAQYALRVVITYVNDDADSTGDVSVGDTITYTYTVTNTGSDDLTGVTVVDDTYGSVTLSDTAGDGVGNLAAGDSETGTTTYIILSGDLGTSIANTATASSNESFDSVDSKTIAVPTPALTVSVVAANDDADGSGDVTEGDEITYTYTVENTGGAVLTGVSVVDDTYGSVTLSDTAGNGVTVLAPGDIETGTKTYTILSGDGGSTITNIVTVSTNEANDVNDSAAVVVVGAFAPAEPTLTSRQMTVNFNANEWQLAGNFPQQPFTNLVWGARGANPNFGGTVTSDNYPNSTTLGQNASYVRYETGFFKANAPEPYYGTFWIYADQDCEATLLVKDTDATSTLETVISNQNITGGVPYSVSVSQQSEDYRLDLRIGEVATPLSELALVHDSHKADYDAGYYFNQDAVDIWMADGALNIKPIVRFMKLHRAEENPSDITTSVVSDCLWVGTDTAKRTIPYEAILSDAKRRGFTPYINIIADWTDAEVRTLAGYISEYGIKVFVELGNEPFLGVIGGSPYQYFLDIANAKWPASGATNQQLVRNAYARRESEMIEIMEEEGVRDLIVWVLGDSGAGNFWITPRFDCGVWDTTATADGERERFNRWTQEGMFDAIAMNAYFDDGQPGTAVDQDAETLYNEMQVDLNIRTFQMGQNFDEIQTHYPHKRIIRMTYEGGNSFPRADSKYIQDTVAMHVTYLNWQLRLETECALEHNLHFADLGNSGLGIGGHWGVVPFIGQALTTEQKGAALQQYIDLPYVYPTVAHTTNQNTTGTNSGFYDIQCGMIQKLDYGTGERTATTYTNRSDTYHFQRGMCTYAGGFLVLGYSNNAAAPSAEVGIGLHSLDLSTEYDFWGVGNTTAASQDGQPEIVSDGVNVWAVMSVDNAITATGSSGGLDTTFDGSITTRIVVLKFSIVDDGAGNPELSLDNHTYIQDQTASGSTFSETHGLRLLPNGELLICGEVYGSFGTLPGQDFQSFDTTAPSQRKGFFMRLEPDLSAVNYASFFGPSGASDDCYFDGVDTDLNGGYCFAMVDANANVPTTDGSTHPDAGENAGALVVFDQWDQQVYTTYVTTANLGAYESAARRAVFDPDGNIYVGGWQAKAGPARAEAQLWKYAKASGLTFDRALNDDATFISDQVSDLGITGSLGWEIKFTPNLEQNLTLIDVGNGHSKVILTDSAAITALTVATRFDSGGYDNAGANAIVAGTEYTLRGIFDGAASTSTVWITGGAYATETQICQASAPGSPVTFTGTDIIALVRGIDSSFDDCEYIRIWYSATTSGTPDMEINGANCNQHRWLVTTGGDLFTGTTDLYSKTWTFGVPNGTGQFRDLHATSDFVVGCGGIESPSTAADFEYSSTDALSWNPSGGPTFNLQGFACRVTAAGARDWLTQWGAEDGGGNDDGYYRSYALAVSRGDVYVVGRAADQLVTGYET